MAERAAKASASAAKKATGGALKDRLARLGIVNRFGLILHLPLRYEDETVVTPLRELHVGAIAQTEGIVDQVEIVTRPRRSLQAKIKDGPYTLTVRLLHFYPSQIEQFTVGHRLRLYGEVRQGYFGYEMVHPKSRVVRAGEAIPTALTPVYPTTAGLTQSALRKLIDRALDEQALDDTLPQTVLSPLALQDFRACVLTLHRPPPSASLQSLDERTHPAWRRLKFDELLAQQLAMRLAYGARQRKRALSLPPSSMLVPALIASLPFPLTQAQRRATAEIARDLQRPHPMQRLLQGDVGSGKTVVAALAALQAIDAGYQVALMAPTEILAEQHYRKLSALLEPLGVRCAWLAGSLKPKEKDAMKTAIAFGDARLAIGTHALFQDDVRFHHLGLAIIDEQHRFGVHQRLQLRAKGADGDYEVHQLMMSATPIPRTLSLSYMADLDVSVIDQLPPGRTPVVTKLASDTRRDEVIRRVRDACKDGAQAYWVCPLIEESETLQLETAEQTFAAIVETFPDLRVGLVHGRMKPKDKAATMHAFHSHALDLLVATTVIEVGVDVPNASLMIIENAERMGLAQLHQLRGRVGRGTRASHCVLLYKAPLSPMGKARLKIIYENEDGFEIARQDLVLRGPGELLGERQSGAPLLRFADLERDGDLLEQARHLADELIAQDSPVIATHLARWVGFREFYLSA
jgi:ATP-dependent DNA helicase RecG